MNIRDETGANRLRKWLLIVAVLVILGLLNFAVYFTSDLAEADANPPQVYLVLELSGTLTLLPLLPAVLWLMRRVRLTRRTLWWSLPVHLAGSMVYGATHTLLMWGSRTVLWRLLGWGVYDYGDMRYRFPMEYGKQVLVYALIYGVVTFVQHLRARREEELRRSRLEQQLSEARLATLRSQLDPHFLFNSLNMISSHVHDQPELAEVMVDRLSAFLRLTLRDAGSAELPLSRELESLDAYLDIMRARFEDRLRITVDVADGAERALVPHLVLQPLVENAIEHGVDDPERPGEVAVTARRDAGRLELTVEDNGPGLPGGNESAVSEGLGLGHTRARLDELYAGAATLTLGPAAVGRGCRAVITIPWRETAVS